MRAQRRVGGVEKGWRHRSVRLSGARRCGCLRLRILDHVSSTVHVRNGWRGSQWVSGGVVRWSAAEMVRTGVNPLAGSMGYTTWGSRAGRVNRLTLNDSPRRRRLGAGQLTAGGRKTVVGRAKGYTETPW